MNKISCKNLFGLLVLALFLSTAAYAAGPAAATLGSSESIGPSGSAGPVGTPSASQPVVSASQTQISQNIARGLPAGYMPGNTNANPSVPTVTAIACSQEAKICPDGSAVGRQGPNCEFAACPLAPISAPTQSPSVISTPAPAPTPTPAPISSASPASTQSSNTQIVPTPSSQPPVSASLTQMAQNLALGLPAVC